MPASLKWMEMVISNHFPSKLAGGFIFLKFSSLFGEDSYFD